MPARFLTSKFIAVMLAQFWDETQRMIIRRQFLPYVLLTAITAIYFHRALSLESEEDELSGSARVVNKLLGLVALPLLALSLWIEYRQLMSEKRKITYFTSAYKWIDIVGLVLTLTVIFLTLCEIKWLSFESMRTMASLACCCLMIKFYDWLRLFESTAFYILLI